MERCVFNIFAILVLSLAGASCGTSPDILASYDGGSISVADFDADVLSLPEKNRAIAPGESHDEWAEQHLRRIGLERILLASEAARRIEASPELAAFRTWSRSELLAESLLSQASQGWQPGPEELAEITREMAGRSDMTVLYNFHHIFFRTDRALEPAAERAIHRRAAEAEDRARSGSDFEALIREYSESEDAERGGELKNIHPSVLEDEAAQVLSMMDEGEISPVVETRTGLHIFRLNRRLETEPLPPQRLEKSARRVLVRRHAEQVRTELLTDLRGRLPVETSGSVWTVGDWEIDETTVDLIAEIGGFPPQMFREHLTDQLLLAQEAIDRGLDTPFFDAEFERSMKAVVFERSFRERRQEVVQELAGERLRELYDSQPSRFNENERARLELIFIPQGRDSFTTQRWAEDLVAELRAGSSFADAARDHSQGPQADNGGDLGFLDQTEWGYLGPAVFESIRSLEPGRISDPIYCTDKVLAQPGVLRGGFAIIRVVERRPERSRSFEEAFDDVRRVWVVKHREEVNEAVIDSILTEGGFRIIRLPTAGELQT